MVSNTKFLFFFRKNLFLTKRDHLSQVLNQYTAIHLETIDKLILWYTIGIHVFIVLRLPYFSGLYSHDYPVTVCSKWVTYSLKKRIMNMNIGVKLIVR